MASSTSTQPSTDGPTTMPATISSTIDGQPQARAQAEQERGGEGDRHDDEQAAELGHALLSDHGRKALRVTSARPAGRLGA